MPRQRKDPADQERNQLGYERAALLQRALCNPELKPKMDGRPYAEVAKIATEFLGFPVTGSNVQYIRSIAAGLGDNPYALAVKPRNVGDEVAKLREELAETRVAVSKLWNRVKSLERARPQAAVGTTEKLI